MKYTDWTSGEPIEKEWTMTDPALRALLDTSLAYIAHLDAPAREHEDGDGCYAAFERAAMDARQTLAEAAAEAAPPLMCAECGEPITDTEDGRVFHEECVTLAAAEAAPLDVDAVLREAEKRVRALPLQDAPAWYSHEYAVREADVLAILAALRSPDTLTSAQHGPCDYNGGPGSDQCPHGVFLDRSPDTETTE